MTRFIPPLVCVSLLGLGLSAPPVPTMPSKPSKAPVATQGSGALQLISKAALPVVVWHTNYFAATCTDNAGLTSDYSMELITRWTNRTMTATFAWDRSPSTNVITKYTLLQGAATRAYTNTVSAGTNLTATMTIPKPPVMVLLVSLTNGPSLSVTNPAEGKAFFRGYAWSVGTKYLTVIQSAPTVRGAWTNATPAVTNTSRPMLRLLEAHVRQ